MEREKTDNSVTDYLSDFIKQNEANLEPQTEMNETN